jgi:hypothetical protein
MHTMKTLNRFLPWALWAFTGFVGAGALSAENTNSMYKLTAPTPGGLSPRPCFLRVTPDDEGLTLTWQGLNGPYQVQTAPTVTDPTWENVGGPTVETSITVPVDHPMAVFQVNAASPIYLGANGCAGCHRDIHEEWQQGPHPHAIESLQEFGVADSPTCLPCHTVGYGYQTGFQSLETTPEKGSVQCENCHGPAGPHAANIADPSIRPKVTVDSATCGGCHNYRFIHRTYDEWQDSQHTPMTGYVAHRILSEGESAMNECGVCHSSAVRLALLDHWQRQQTNPGASLNLPSREDAAYFAVGCVACHQPHNPSQFRNPLNSTENYSYDPDVPFVEQYNPDVQVCAQCHNERGADWRDTARPPHRSPQYNVLVGQAGYDPDHTNMVRSHALVEGQCIGCHSQGYGNGQLTKGPYTGHTTQVDYEQCSACHGSAEIGKLLQQGTQMITHERVAELLDRLDTWGETKAPLELRVKYGRLAWEYTKVGSLSNPDGDPELTGPTAEEQALIPATIKQARLNLYLVDGDGSYGVHNGGYTRHLLDVALANVEAELAGP